MKKHRYFPEDVKRSAVGRVGGGEAVSTVARDVGVDRRRLYEWCHKHQEGGPEALRRTGRPRKAEALSARARSWQAAPDEPSAARRQIAELERKIGEQQVDLDFFREALRRVKEIRQAPAGRGAMSSTKSSKR